MAVGEVIFKGYGQFLEHPREDARTFQMPFPAPTIAGCPKRWRKANRLKWEGFPVVICLLYRKGLNFNLSFKHDLLPGVIAFTYPATELLPALSCV